MIYSENDMVMIAMEELNYPFHTKLFLPVFQWHRCSFKVIRFSLNEIAFSSYQSKLKEIFIFFFLYFVFNNLTLSLYVAFWLKQFSAMLSNEIWNSHINFFQRIFIWHCLLIFFRPSKVKEHVTSRVCWGDLKIN